jgi:hypothetical protein
MFQTFVKTKFPRKDHPGPILRNGATQFYGDQTGVPAPGVELIIDAKHLHYIDQKSLINQLIDLTQKHSIHSQSDMLILYEGRWH